MYLSCAGIGVGPSNLSLACLLHSYPRLTGMFFERKKTFSWYEGMLLPGTGLQVAIFKDLVTLADPRSFYSFVSYLHESGKLYHFVNARFDDVPRKEFENYMKWASSKNSLVHFDEEVIEVRLSARGMFEVHTSKRRVEAENVIVGVGITPYVPPCAAGFSSDDQFHVSDFVNKAAHLAGKRVVVVGGGQSGAEAFLNLISRDGDAAPASVCWVSRRENFLPMDDSPFTNEYFMPSHSDYFFSQDPEFRYSFVRRNILASDGVSERTLRNIYQRIYALRLIDQRRPETLLAPNRSVEGLSRIDGAWRLEIQRYPGGGGDSIAADTIIWATGFRKAPTEFLAPLAGRFEFEGEEVRIDNDFAAVWDGPVGRRIFLLNAARQQRGLADPNLSLMAWRSQRVLERITGEPESRPKAQPAFVPWSSGPLERTRSPLQSG